jgi:hypothetical protein
MKVKSPPIVMLCLTGAFWALSCQTGAEAFVDDRLMSICDEAYQICDLPAGCVLDRNHYIEGAFPGSRRFVVVTESRDVKIVVRIFFESQVATGTQLIVRAYEPNCSVDTAKAQVIMENVDIFKKAGDDRMLDFELAVADEGEHLIEINSDASAEYLIVFTQKY